MASRHRLYFGAFVVTAFSFVAVGLRGLVDALGVLTSDAIVYGEEFVLLSMLGEAAERILVALVLGALSVVFLLATVVSVLRNTSLHRDDRLVGHDSAVAPIT